MALNNYNFYNLYQKLLKMEEELIAYNKNDEIKISKYGKKENTPNKNRFKFKNSTIVLLLSLSLIFIFLIFENLAQINILSKEENPNKKNYKR